jgi:HTH-type transcriptional regulator, cell division transcriptional repressor
VPEEIPKNHQPRNLIGPRMRLARRKALPYVSQEDLVARLETYGVLLTQSAISKIEQGTRIVTDHELKAIASSLAVSVGWLVEEEETFAASRWPEENEGKKR